MSVAPKWRPFEMQRQKRLMELHYWGKANLTNEEIFSDAGVIKLREKALEDFGVSLMTATNYAKVVCWKLRKEMRSAV